MKYVIGLSLFMIAVAMTVGAEPGQETGVDEGAATREASAEESLRQNARQFVEAFNNADAGGIGALFTESAEYITADGKRLRGRAQIEEDFAGLFEQNRGLQIGMAIDSLRLLGSNIAIEDGRTWLLRAPVGAPTTSRYTVTHTKENGRWLVASVRETDEEVASHYKYLKDLQWLIGTWSAESGGTRIQTTCEWISNKNFMKRTYSTHRRDEVVSSGTQIIGWDPSREQITAWMFDSSGGHGRAVISQRGNQMVIQTAAVLTDSSQATATNIITPLDHNHFTWTSTNRSINGEQLADVEPVTAIRVTLSATLPRK